MKNSETIWSNNSFIETVSPFEIKEKNRTIHMKHNEEMNYNCKKCNIIISAHNKDWHNFMCDKCFDEMLSK